MSNTKRFSSRKEVTEFLKEKGIDTSNWSEEKWLQINKGQAEIHIMELSEKIYDAIQESIPKQLKSGEWHIPFGENINNDGGKFVRFMMDYTKNRQLHTYPDGTGEVDMTKVKVSTAMAARTSYTVVGEERGVDYAKMIELHDRLIAQDPPHSSPMEHCCLVVTEEEYNNSFKGREKGWFRNFKGFIQYRHIIENELKV